MAETGERIINAVIILAALLFVAGPLAAVAISGLQADLLRLAGEPAVHKATLTSLILAFCAAILCVALSLSLAAARRALELKRPRTARPSALERMLDTGASFVLVVPPIVVGAGWFVALRGTGQIFTAAPIMVVAVNAVMATPFAIRVIRPAWDAASARHERLASQLGISGLNRLRLIDWPSIRRPAFTALAFAMALSLGDLGVIALFGSESVQTLPYLLLARMGSYRTMDAAGLALILGLVCLGLSMLAERGRIAR